MLYAVKRNNSPFDEPESRWWFVACLSWYLWVFFPVVWLLDTIQNKLIKTKN